MHEYRREKLAMKEAYINNKEAEMKQKEAEMMNKQIKLEQKDHAILMTDNN